MRQIDVKHIGFFGIGMPSNTPGFWKYLKT
ncbi:hypothetical protein PS691_05200 [Pseudomonas fluorescens]|uniref:Uncharacterized protein n=1 Tax=Pseudomonas fluorescens TaxID=294 RepID=A0A5E7FA12_PSEFL|nr:hypothetical protein PS691_05200 [Pseudomonas fluorescens]